MKLFGLNISRGKAGAIQVKASPTWANIIAFLGGQQVVYTSTDYAKIVEAGYQINATAHACVAMIAKSAGRIVWYAQKKQRTGDMAEVESHPLLDLMARPNEYSNGAQFIEAVVSYRLLAGNSYIHRVGIGKQPPRFLYPLRPDRMMIKPGTASALVGGYSYRVNGRDLSIPTEEVLHLREFHPLDDFYGLSKLEVAARSIDISNWAAEWNLKLLQNDMRPPGILDIKGQLTELQREKLAEQMKSKYQGGMNAGTPLIVESGSGVEWRSTAVTPKDMDWLNSEKFNMRRICAVFGVASELLGDSENKTYSNIQEARKALYMESVLPVMDELRDAFNGWLAPLYGDDIRLEYDRDAIEALQEDRAQKYAYLGTAKWLTINEKRDASGYDDLGPNGDVVLVSMGEIPLDQATAEPEPVPDAFADAEDEPVEDDEDATGAAKSTKSIKAAWSAPERKRALWDNFTLRVEARAKGVTGLALAYLKDQAERVSKARSVDVKAEAAIFAKVMKPWAYATAQHAISAGVSASKGDMPELESKVNLTNLTEARKKRIDDMILRSGTKIAESTMGYVRDTLALAEAQNWTVEELTQNLIAKLDEFAQWRCRTIARTEGAKVENWGQVEGYRDIEFVTRKGWMCSFVEDSRDSHIEANDQEVGIDEPFIVGGMKMDYPGDPAGDAGETVNCLCTTYPVVD